MKEFSFDMSAPFPHRQFESTEELVASTSDDVYVMPTSVAQQRFWILDQLEPGNTSLNMPLALSLTGKLDVDALERTLNEIVSRHEVLRTTFSKNDGKPVQVIAARQAFHLDVVDLSDHSDKEDESNRIKVEEAHHTFDLQRGPLFKAKLIRLEAEDHILLLTLHHIVCDGWSNGVLVREVGEIYDAFSQGLPSPHDELPIQYADFAAWQQEWLDSDGFDDQLAYWKQQLGNELPALDIPTDFPRNKNRASFGDIESLLLPQPLTRAIKALSQREDATPFMIFLTAFNVLLHRYSGQDNILVGSPTANRQQSETEGLIGAFANTLLLKTDVSGVPTFNELLQRVKDVSLGAFSNQTFPFEKLVEKIRPSTNGRKGGQLFQVMFIFQTAFMQQMDLPQLTIKPIRSISPGSIFELSLGIVERSEGTRLQLEYNTDLFKTETVRFMLEDLQTILQAAVLDSNRTISDLLQWTTPLRSRKDDQTVGESTAPLATTAVVVPSAVSGEGVEETLTKIWQDVLHVDSISRDDDFFEIGGHSLLAAQLFDEIKKKLGVNLPLATLFTATTIRELAELIRADLPSPVAGEGVEQTLTKIWQEVLHVESISRDDDFFEIGGHSLLAAQLFDEIKKKLGVNLPLATLFTATTIEELAKLIRQEKPKDVWTSLVPINSQGTKPPLFLMHAAGGNVLFYKDLADRLGKDQPCYGMQAVGLSGHQSAYDRIEDMAAHYIKEIRGVQPNGPYHVGGSSLGGLIAYEVGMQLRRQGEEVDLIALIDTWAPGFPKPLPGVSRTKIKFFSFTDRVLHHVDTLRILERGSRWAYVQAKAIKVKNQVRRTYKQTKRKIARGVLNSLGRPLPDSLLVTQNAIATASRTYNPPTFEGDVTLFRASDRSRVLCHEDTLGWSNFVKGRLDIVEVNGSHGSIAVEPRVRYVAAKLVDLLDGSNNAVRSQVAKATNSGIN